MIRLKNDYDIEKLKKWKIIIVFILKKICVHIFCCVIETCFLFISFRLNQKWISSGIDQSSFARLDRFKDNLRSLIVADSFSLYEAFSNKPSIENLSSISLFPWQLFNRDSIFRSARASL